MYNELIDIIDSIEEPMLNIEYNNRYQSMEYGFETGIALVNQGFKDSLSEADYDDASGIFSEIEYDEHSLGCGLEDNGIVNDNDAFEYGYNQAIDKVIQEIDYNYG